TVFDPRTVGGGRTTYGAITAGLTIKPRVPAPLTGLMIRPEIRYDRSLNGTDPLNDSSDRDMFTAAVDVVVMFLGCAAIPFDVRAEPEMRAHSWLERNTPRTWRNPPLNGQYLTR